VFLDAYRGAMSASEGLLPADEARFDDGLKLMIVEKALYEVRYELNNRPDWLPIPLNALRRLAGVPVPGSAL
jgi:maltose alpha-D-glucosyltransferase/alpha-amylase